MQPRLKYKEVIFETIYMFKDIIYFKCQMVIEVFQFISYSSCGFGPLVQETKDEEIKAFFYVFCTNIVSVW